MASSERFCRMHGLRHHVHWAVSLKECPAVFSDLFSANKRFPLRARRGILDSALILRPKFRFWIKKSELKDLDASLYSQNDAGFYTLNHGSIYQTPEIALEYATALKTLQPSQVVLNRLECFMKGKSIPLGIHVRQGDFLGHSSYVTPLAFANYLSEVMDGLGSEPFFLATDSEEVRTDFLHKFPGRCLVLDDVDTDRESVQNCIDGLVEMYILSKCEKLILSPDSTFSTVAWLLSACKARIINLDEGGKPSIPA